MLGFKKLAEVISNQKGIESRLVRNHFVDVINDRIGKIEEKSYITEMKYSESDDWLLVADSLDKTFKIIFEILDHNTGYEDYEKIPMELAVGTAEYDKWAKLGGRNLITEDETINFLKTNIISYYHKWYKDINKQSPMSTFIIFTELAYQELEPLDKKICNKIEYEQNKFFVADVDKIIQRGELSEFLKKIGHADNKLYERIDDVYIPPIEYEEIRRTLNETRIVLITGTQEYGKTYTAVRLMWEYFKQGYEPKWFRGGEKDDRKTVREKLENIKAELKPGHIIYFEDPFGKTQYEKRESLEREIGTILDMVIHIKDVYVIITSREEVFKEFEKEKLSAKDLKAFENKLNIKKPSYDYDKRAAILCKWAENENCKWFGNRKLKELVLESLKDKEILPTPLSIKNFVNATIDIEKVDELREKIEEKSEETEKAFAEEIKNMSGDKILFLSFLFISDLIDSGFVKREYQEITEQLGLNNAWEFDRVLKWFKDDKIGIINRYGKKYLSFSHPSYSKSLEYLLIEDGFITNINEMFFSKLLIKLSEKDAVAGAVARAVADHFDRLPEGVRNLLFTLSEKDAAARAVAMAIADHFDKLPEDVRNKLLIKLSEKDSA